MNWTTSYIFMLIGATYPISVYIKLRNDKKDCLRWLKNSPSFNLYVLLVFPIAVGTFVVSTDIPSVVIALSSKIHFFLLLLIFGILLMIAVFAAIDDLRRPVAEPYMFKEHAEALKWDKSKRVELKNASFHTARIMDVNEKSEAEKADRDSRINAVNFYANQFPCLNDVHGLNERGSVCAWIAFGLNFLIGVFTATLFAYLVAIAFLQDLSISNQGLLICVGLMVIWFPIRIYTEWYLHFYSLFHLRVYYAFWFLLFVTFGAYVSLFLDANSFAHAAFSSIGTGLLLIIGALSKFKPAWLFLSFDIIEQLPIKWYLATLFILMLIFAVSVNALLNGY